MASIRMLKKDVDYLVEEILADCFLTIYFQPAKEEMVVNIIRGAVDLRNELFNRVYFPLESKSRKDIRKHYSQMRQDLATGADRLLSELSAVCRK